MQLGSNRIWSKHETVLGYDFHISYMNSGKYGLGQKHRLEGIFQNALSNRIFSCNFSKRHRAFSIFYEKYNFFSDRQIHCPTHRWKLFPMFMHLPENPLPKLTVVFIRVNPATSSTLMDKFDVLETNVSERKIFAQQSHWLVGESHSSEIITLYNSPIAFPFAPLSNFCF